ncbi:MAG TPA: ATP-binding cassette domain-containing protein, partial [Acetobacteraceae bacterium]|nr:ATP-binding cassette domain-containing protein [Acetobacteraceae bacterium]
HPVLHDIAFTAAPGSVVALFGPSGTGKTTTLRIVMGLDADFEGRIGKLPGRLGAMFQEPRLAPWMTVADNLRMVVTEGVPPPDIPALLAEVGLPGAERRLPRELSLGMARRAALARALAVSPAVLVLDEPFASLDPQLAGSLAGVIRARASRTGTAVLLSTHDLDPVFAIADRILVLSGHPATLAGDVALPAGAAARQRARADLLRAFPFLARAEAQSEPEYPHPHPLPQVGEGEESSS